ncbi:MAG: superoxide dismutase [Anaerolineales bacterium]|nr:superoxide dismutase [Anaerolineales bacterium]
MRMIALEKEISGFSAEEFRPHLKAEAARVWQLYQAGTIREIYFRADVSEAVLILEVADVNEANAVLATLPLVKAGLITFDIIPLRPYTGFARLFEGE